MHKSIKNSKSMNTNTSQPNTFIKDRLAHDTNNNTTIHNLTSHNLRLTGEVAILRQNLITLERENYQLKQHSNTKILASLKNSENLKRELRILQSENRINENRLRAIKRPKSGTEGEINFRWILKQINSEIRFELWPVEVKRLNILSGYFYEDFEKLLNDEGIEDQLQKLHGNFEDLCSLFMIFSSKKYIFDSFFQFIFEVYFEQNNDKLAFMVYRILCYCELNWILSFIENDVFMQMLNDFLENTTHEKMTLVFYARIIKERPFLLNIVLNKSRFQKIIEHEYAFIDCFLDLLPLDNFRNYISSKNIKLIDKRFLKKIFTDEYFEIF